MASILDGLNIAKLSLSAQQFAMNVTQRNTVNLNNPNYTRQELFFNDLTMPENWSSSGAPGVMLHASRNRYLDQSISYQLPSLGENTVKYNELNEIDSILQATSGGGLGTSIDEFFNSFIELSSTPTDSALRWQVIPAAETMAADFKRIYENIQSVQTGINRHIEDGVREINDLTAKIADLNDRIEIAHLHNRLETEYALRDERQQSIEELMDKADFRYFETEAGSITVTTTKGDALVLGNKSENLVYGNLLDEQGNIVDSPFQGLYLENGAYANIASGEIGGYINMRDTLIPGYLKTMDEMAAEIVSEVNAVHRQGFGLDGSTGIDFFVPLSGAGPASRSMTVNIKNIDEIAAASVPNEAGNNENAKALAQIGTSKLFGNTKTLSEAYAELIYTVGSDKQTSKAIGDNQQKVLDKFLSQRYAASGVSLNNEAVNLIKFQRAYQASSRFVTVLNSLSAEILNFVGV